MANLRPRYDKDGKLIGYTVRVSMGRDDTGKQRKCASAKFDIEPSWSEKYALKKAQQFAVKFEEECQTNAYLTADKPSFKEYSDYVIKLKETRGRKNKTIAFYRGKEVLAVKKLGKKKIQDITTRDINRFYTELLGNHVSAKGKKLSIETVKGYHRYLSMVFEQAVKEELIPLAPTAHAELPSSPRHKTPNYYQLDEIKAIQDALADEEPQWQMFVHLLIVTGARRGELVGLKWEDIDFDNCRIHIARSVLYTPGYGTYISTPKSETSIRWITIPQSIAQELQEYKAYKNEQIKQWPSYVEQGFIFSNKTGLYIHPDSAGTWLQRFEVRKNLPIHLNCHAFRHTQASILFYGGMDAVSISHRLGHAQPSTTSDIYGHLISQADDKACRTLEKALGQPETQK